MACLEVKHISHNIKRWVRENENYSQDWKMTGRIDWSCEAQALDDFDSLVTSDGFMVGNAIKKVTNFLGIHQCMQCKQRQRRFNAVGLALQQKVKDLF